jgi:excisionase family DNA binding protein
MQQERQLERLLTVAEVAEQLGVSDKQIYAAVHAGELAFLPGRTWRFRSHDVEAYLANAVQVGVEPAPALSAPPRRRSALRSG